MMKGLMWVVFGALAVVVGIYAGIVYTALLG